MEHMKDVIAAMIAQTRYAEAECEERLRSKMIEIRHLGNAALDLREGNQPLEAEDVWGTDESNSGGRR